MLCVFSREPGGSRSDPSNLSEDAEKHAQVKKSSALLSPALMRCAPSNASIVDIQTSGNEIKKLIKTPNSSRFARSTSAGARTLACAGYAALYTAQN